MTYLLALSLILNVVFAYAFLSVHVRALRQFEQERTNLLDRIQSPQEAVVQSLYPEATGEPAYIPLDDDEAYVNYLKGTR